MHEVVEGFKNTVSVSWAVGEQAVSRQYFLSLQCWKRGPAQPALGTERETEVTDSW